MRTAKEISKMLAERADGVAKYLLPNGKKFGNEWCCGSVTGESGESLKVHLAGEKAGVFCDFATGDTGDLLTLWSLVRNLTLSKTLREAVSWLGIASPQFESYRAPGIKKIALKSLSVLREDSVIMDYLFRERKLTQDVISKFKIGERGRTIVFNYFHGDEIVFVKYLDLERPNGKKHFRVEKDCEPCLFGWHVIADDTRTVVLCEGEIDAMSLHQYGHQALSVPFGGGRGNKHKWVEYEFDRLAIFDEIYLCFDNDHEGQVAAEVLVERLGRHRCRIVELPYKDANACLQGAISKEEIDECFKNARTFDPRELKRASSFASEVIDEFYPPQGKALGIEPPWEKAKDKILFRPDELSIWTGINGHGKSQFLGQIVLHAMHQGSRICIASLELKPRRLLMRLTRQTAGIAQPSSAYIKAIHEWYDDRLWVFDLVGNAKSDRLLEVFKYARQRYGIDIFVIDSLMKLDISEDDYRAQKAFLEKLCDFKNEHNCHVHLVVHPRKGMDETKMPGKLDAKGTGAITDLADNCFVVWRNKSKQEKLQKILLDGQLPSQQLKNEIDALWVCDKQRNGEFEGKIGLWFHSESCQYLNHPNQKAIPYVNLTNLITLNS